MEGRYAVQLQGWDSDQWEDVLYTDDHDRAARLAKGMQGNPRVRAGRVTDAKVESPGQELDNVKESSVVCAGK